MTISWMGVRVSSAAWWDVWTVWISSTAVFVMPTLPTLSMLLNASTAMPPRTSFSTIMSLVFLFCYCVTELMMLGALVKRYWHSLKRSLAVPGDSHETCRCVYVPGVCHESCRCVCMNCLLSVDGWTSATRHSLQRRYRYTFTHYFTL